MRIYQVDAFTDQIFKGNPAGVCILPPGKIENSSLLQNIAKEMNLSETAFLSRQDDEYRLRWFMPKTEVRLCGHATLSSAHILWETGQEKEQSEIRFNTLSGKLMASKHQGKIELDFPAFGVEKIHNQPYITGAFGVSPIFTGLTNNRYLIELSDYGTLKEMKPDFGKLKEAGKAAFIVTCKSEFPEYDFYSRFFAPAVGIDENPVTGSSHTSLAPYWSQKLGKRTLKCYQASERGGVLECEVTPNGRVLIRGKAVTVFESDAKIELST
jgi:PhzF family phenazine biosynthesis protein